MLCTALKKGKILTSEVYGKILDRTLRQTFRVDYKSSDGDALHQLGEWRSLSNMSLAWALKNIGTASLLIRRDPYVLTPVDFCIVIV